MTPLPDCRESLHETRILAMWPSRKSELGIATYPYPDALQALKNVAGGRGERCQGGGFALIDVTSPKSVHIAYRRVNYQVEVFGPSAAQSQRIAFS